MTSVFITAGTGQLGKLTVESLLPDVEAKTITLTISTRDASRVPSQWTDKGVKVQVIDYKDSTEKWTEALQGVERVLLISSSTRDADERVEEQTHIIEAAKKANVALLAYTSVLRADQANFIIAQSHRATEKVIRSSGVPFVLLRNGWYIENWLMSAGSWEHTGKHFSAAGDANFSAAARKDYAEAAATVLRPSYTETNKVYELGGDSAFNLDEMARVASKYAGTPVQHNSLPQAKFVDVLVQFGSLPEDLANALADADVSAKENNSLYTDSKDLRDLIGHPTRTLEQVFSEYFASLRK